MDAASAKFGITVRADPPKAKHASLAAEKAILLHVRVFEDAGKEILKKQEAKKVQEKQFEAKIKRLTEANHGEQLERAMDLRISTHLRAAGVQPKQVASVAN